MSSYAQDSKNKLNITLVGFGWYIVMTIVGVWNGVAIMTGASASILLLITACLVFQLIRRKQSEGNSPSSL